MKLPYGQDERDLHAATEAIIRMSNLPPDDAATEPPKPSTAVPEGDPVGGGSGHYQSAVRAELNNPTSLSTRGSTLRAATDRGWPKPLAEEAFHGVAGDFVRTIEPHSESDPAAILMQLLTGFGNAAGRHAYFRVGSDAHYTNLSAVVVGETARGRKGSSWTVVLEQLNVCDSEWAQNRISTGLSTGEGLIWAVRDQIEELEPIRDHKTKKIIDYQKRITDEGEPDKRLLVVEPEFARVLQVAGRDANTLTAVLRQGWDSGTLRILTRSRPVHATGAHISIIGHITRDELLKYLATTEMANGFCNRILWICSRRSKLLPDGGELFRVDMGPLLRRLNEALHFAQAVGELTRDLEARDLWHDVYGHLGEDRLGLLGAVTSRAEAQVLRLSCIYALLDRSAVVGLRHLVAALEVWKYCEQSAKYIFGDAIGDVTADVILHALRGVSAGLTRTDISHLFDRKKPATDITRALNVLQSHHLVRSLKEETAGRPTERWLTA